MMQLYAALNAHGVPLVLSTTQGDGMVEVPEGVDPMVSMCPTGAWEPRPVVDVLVSGNRIDLTNIPPGTALEVIDVEASAILAEVVLDGDEIISLPDAGTYQIDVRPPMPWLGWQGSLTC